MPILALTRYQRLGSSSRVRFYQYFPYLEAHGLEIINAPFFDDKYVRKLYAGRRTSLPTILKAYINRLITLIREKNIGLIWVEKEFLPWFPSEIELLFHSRKIPYVVDYDDAVFHRYDMHPNMFVRRFLGHKIDHVMGNASMVIADLHFAPTEWSRANLLREGVGSENILVTGNSVIDALHWVSKFPFDFALTEKVGLDLRTLEKKGTKIILVTAHRRENFGTPLENICTAILDLANSYGGDVHFIYPVHLNPNVQSSVYRLLSRHPHITLIPPLEYLPLINVLKRSTLVLTDSGGLQEEAPGLGIPVLVLREVTERPEGVEAGTVKLVGTDSGIIIKTVHTLLDNAQDYERMTKSVNPYGDGHAAERIVEAVVNFDQDK